VLPARPLWIEWLDDICEEIYSLVRNPTRRRNDPTVK